MASNKYKIQNPSNPIKYRPDIDGLRAIAVLLVVFYHAGFDNIISGGFIGVDIFFVISGYLITKIITQNLKKEKFSIINFYERRVRRILPALFLVIFFCLVASSILLLPDEFSKFGQSVIATNLFISNILFWHETGYFNASADLKPLLHTWSLSVEEQFYIFFPLFLIITYKFSSSFKLPIICILATLSFVLSIWATTYAMTANFYFAPTRAWELLIGSILSLLNTPKKHRIWILEAMGILGLSFIIFAGLNFSYATPFPGIYALIPCLGAALIIYSGQTKYKTTTSYILGLKPFILIGLCSYSLYLWHWPIILFVKYLSATIPPAPIMLATIVFSLFISYLSWQYIETPIRKKTVFPTTKNIFSFALLTSTIFIGIGGFIAIKSGIPQRFDNIQQLEELKKKNFDDKCIDIPAKNFRKNKCYFGNKNSTKNNYLIWGDSHARAMTPAIVSSANRNGNFLGSLSSNSGCPPLIDIELRHKKDNETCTKINNVTFQSIDKGMRVFLVARWNYYTDRSPINKEGPVWIKDNQSSQRSENENYAVLQRGLSTTIKKIIEKGAPVVLVGPVPEFPKDVVNLYWQFNKKATISKEIYKKRTKKLNGIIDDIRKQYDITYINPSKIFCDDLICTSIIGDKILFRDNDHISPEGAQKISPLYDPVFKK